MGKLDNMRKYKNVYFSKFHEMTHRVEADHQAGHFSYLKTEVTSTKQRYMDIMVKDE